MSLRISRRTVYSVGKPSVYTDGHIPSVYTDESTDGINLSVYTDGFGDGIVSVGIHYRRNIFVGNSVAFLRFSGSGGCTRLNIDLMVASSGIKHVWLLGVSLSKKVLITLKPLVRSSNRRPSD
jgi:hypothetical protein